MVHILDGYSEIASEGQINLLFDWFKAFDEIVSCHKSDYFFRKDLFSFMRAQRVLSYHVIPGFRSVVSLLPGLKNPAISSLQCDPERSEQNRYLRSKIFRFSPLQQILRSRPGNI